MALFQVSFFSETLALCSSMNVLLPEKAAGQIGMAGRKREDKHPVLLLLHGLSDDHTIWLRRTSIERYVSAMGLAVVMPAVGRSFYTDMENGLKYWTYVSEEVLPRAREFFPISDRRQDTFVAGLSMGGYGAFKLALRRPDLFAAAASLSGWLNGAGYIKRVLRGGESVMGKQEFESIFGPARRFPGGDNDLMALATSASKKKADLPKLLQICGTEDSLYRDNLAFREHAQKLGLHLDFEDHPGGHEWGFWDRHIQRVLNWLPLK